MKTKKAFTLIELLVVIAIIGILATISVLALQNARAKSRDAKRVGDIKQVQTALELFYNDNNRYPTTNEWNTGKIYSAVSGVTSTYMQIIPLAPTPNDGGCTTGQNALSYIPTSDGTSYSISFCLGGTTGVLASGPKCLTPGGIIDVDCSGGGGSGTLGCTQDSDCDQINNEFCCTDSGSQTCAYQTCVDQVTYEGGPNSGKYNVVYIGTQYWLKENLNVGTMLCSSNPGGGSCGTNQGDANSGVFQKYCYNNLTSNCDTYGALYQWHTVVGLQTACDYSSCTPLSYPQTQGLCPTGWHIPTHDEFTDLELAICSSGTCATDFPHDNSTNGWRGTNEATKLGLFITGGTNSSGFTLLPAGSAVSFGSFGALGTDGYSWTSTVYDSMSSWLRSTVDWITTIARNNANRDFSAPVRCIKN